MHLYCAICWLSMILIAFSMKMFYDYIKPRRWLKDTMVYLWLASVILGTVSFVSILITEVLG